MDCEGEPQYCRRIPVIRGLSTRDGFSTPFKCRGRLRDTIRRQPDFASDLLQLEKRQASDRRQGLRGSSFRTDGLIENLPVFILLVPAFLAHVELLPWQRRHHSSSPSDQPSHILVGR